MTEISNKITLSEPNCSPMFGYRHRSRQEKLAEWLRQLRDHMEQLKYVLKKDPPSKPGLVAHMASNKRRARSMR